MAVAELSGADDRSGEPPLIAAWYGLAVLTLASTFSLVVRDVIQLEIEPIKHALGLSDTAIGSINGVALTLVIVIAVFPVGWLADRMDRRVLLAICVVAWSAATAWCGSVQSFEQLFLGSMGIGLAETVLGPIGYSLIADLFPRRLWLWANYVNSAVLVLGAGFAISLTGSMIGAIDANRQALPAAFANTETWRLSLFGAALPGPAIAVLILLMRLKKRGPMSPAAAGHGVLAYFRREGRSVWSVFVAYGLVNAGFATSAQWTTVILVRQFGETPAVSGERFGLVVAAASLAGVIGSALLVRRLAGRFHTLAPLVVGRLGIALAFVFTLFYLFCSQVWMVYAVVFFQVFAAYGALTTAPTIFQFMTPYEVRNRALAIGGMIGFFFLTLSPLAVGWLSDLIGNRVGGLQGASLMVSLPAFAAAIVLLGLAAPTLPGTFARAEAADA